MGKNEQDKYRITFHDGPEGNRSKDVDIYAKSLDDAMDKALDMPEAKERLYRNVSVMAIPKEAAIIGVEYEYYDKAAERNFTDRFFIKAENEKQAIDYYNKHYKGNRYGTFYDNKSNKSERFIRGKVLNTYFAVAVTYDADATVPEKKESLEEKISQAKGKAEKLKSNSEKRENREKI